VTGDSSSNGSQSELQKQKEESLRREIEQEKMLREKFQRELEEMKQKLSKLSTTPSQLTTLPLPLEVN
jgi:septin family protein